MLVWLLEWFYLDWCVSLAKILRHQFCWISFELYSYIDGETRIICQIMLSHRYYQLKANELKVYN